MERSLSATSLEEENVRVVVRIRPLQTMEKKNGDIACVKANADGKEVQVKVGPLDAQVYKCNLCFPNDTTQATFFHESGITSLLDSAIQGYRACAFAFGQTGAGKTFTMVGPSKGIHHKDKQHGMIARSLEYVFMKLNSMNVQYNVKIACTEIYHENVFDLFADERERVSLPVREHSTDGFFLEGCKMIECADYEVACGALDVAMRHRITGGHDMNSRSSRSHCLTEIYIEIPSKPNTASVIVNEENDEYDNGESQFITRGRMSLVDLAGSERLKSTNSTGKVLHEAGFINRSLYVLGKVIAGLVRTNGDLNHKDVPYRDSKLTKLLISSLSGRCHTLLISCVSEAKGSQNETLRTLKFSMSCARIRNKPVKFLDPHDRLILDLREEIKRLKNENKKLRSNLLTAPASGEKMYSNHLSDDDSVSVRHRAISAHSSLAPNNKKKKATNPRDVGGYSSGFGSPKKKLISQKMKKSHSDFVAELGKRRDTRNIELALKNAIHDSASLHNNHHSSIRNAVSSSILDTRIDESEEDALSYVSKRSNQPKETPTKNNTNDNNDEDSEYDSVASAAKRKLSQIQLEDVVGRRASGPMVFKTNEPLGPVRQTHALPMNNYEKAMEASRIEKLERRIAKMEKLEARRKREADAVAADPNHHSSVAQHSHNHNSNNNHVTLDKYLSVHEGASPAKANGAGSVSGVDDASSVGQAAKIKKTKPKKAKPAPKKDSPYLAHVNKPAPGKPKASAAAPSKSDGIAAPATADPTILSHNASNTSLDSAHSSVLQDSILAELAEYGLDAPAPPVVAAATKKTTIKRGKLPTINTNSNSNNSEGKRSKAPGAGAAVKLPNIKSVESVQQSQPTKKMHVPIPQGVKSPKKKTNRPAFLESPTRTPPTNFNRMNSLGKIISPTAAASVQAVKSKLDVLEMSLSAKRIEMEDNPGEVTTEAEEQLVALQKEAKVMRKELEIAAGNYDYEYGDDDFEADEDEDAVPVSAHAGAAGADVVRSVAQVTPVKLTPINTTNLEASRSGSQPPTPQAVKDVAFAIQTISNSSLLSSEGGGSAKSSAVKTRVKTPAGKSPKRSVQINNNNNDDDNDDEYADDYGDDADFEADEDVPVAKTPVKAAPPTIPASSNKLTIDTAPTYSPSIINTKSSDKYNNNANTAASNKVQEPATTGLRSNESAYPYNPSPLKSEHPSTTSSNQSSKNSIAAEPIVSTGYSPSGMKASNTAVSTKAPVTSGVSFKDTSSSSRKVLPPVKPVESDDDEHYDNDFDANKHDNENNSQEEDYFAVLERNKREAAAAASSKGSYNSSVAAISKLNKSNSVTSVSDKSVSFPSSTAVPAAVTSSNGLNNYDSYFDRSASSDKQDVPTTTKSATAAVVAAVSAVTPKKPATPGYAYDDFDVEETNLDTMNVISPRSDDLNNATTTATKNSSVKASAVTSKTISPSKSSGSNNNKEEEQEEGDDDDDHMDTGGYADEFDEYDVSFES